MYRFMYTIRNLHNLNVCINVRIMTIMTDIYLHHSPHFATILAPYPMTMSYFVP